MAQCHLDRHAAFGSPDVDDRAVAVPGELVGDRHRRAHADAGHGMEELREALSVLVEGGEEVLANGRLVLGKAGAQRIGERAPKGVEPDVGHLQDAADIGRLGLVEEQVCGRSVRILTIPTFEHAERDQRVKPVGGTPRLQP